MRFTYSARTKSGERVEGTIEADSKSEAIRNVERLGTTPISIVPTTAAGARQVAPVGGTRLRQRGESASKYSADMSLPFGNNGELRDFIHEGVGISRTLLNVMFGLGLILGFLIPGIFACLAKKAQGWVYFTLYALFLLFVKLGVFMPVAGVLAAGIYIAGWLRANIILSRYRRAARQRLSVLTQQEASVGENLERAILLHKVLNDRAAALPLLASALREPGGEAFMLHQAGQVMASNKRYGEACQFYDRASAETTDSDLLKRITSHRQAAAKRAR